MKSLEKNSDFVITFRFYFVFLLLLGIIYPVFITMTASKIFSFQSSGSLILRKENKIASSLLAQKTNTENFFLLRPSAVDYSTIPSGASNLGKTSLILSEQIKERKEKLTGLGIDLVKCEELLYTSGSGLDPHITPICAKEQARILSEKFQISAEFLLGLINARVEPALFGFIGRERVNVNHLNESLKLFLDAR